MKRFRKKAKTSIDVSNLSLSDRELWDGVGIDQDQLEREAWNHFQSYCGQEYEWHGEPPYIFLCTKAKDHLTKDNWHEGITANCMCRWTFDKSEVIFENSGEYETGPATTTRD